MTIKMLPRHSQCGNFAVFQAKMQEKGQTFADLSSEVQEKAREMRCSEIGW
jgi:hypothetical protein